MSATVRAPEHDRIAEIVPLIAVPTMLLIPTDHSRTTTPAQLAARPQVLFLHLQGAAHGPAVGAWLESLAAQGRVDEVGDYMAALPLLRAGRAAAFPAAMLLKPLRRIRGQPTPESARQAYSRSGLGWQFISS